MTTNNLPEDYQKKQKEDNNNMYPERLKNVPVMRYCAFACIYCNFQRFLKLNPCEQCKTNEIHSHLEVLSRTPPKTAPGQFLTVGLSGDVSFMTLGDFWSVIEYCRKWKDRTFLIQSKNPAYFLLFQEHIAPLRIPDNVLFGTTIETDSDFFPESDYFPYYCNISSAPLPQHRSMAMKELHSRKAITIEPILDFSLELFTLWLTEINPEFCYIGYANDRYEGRKFKLPEPPLEKTMKLITVLRKAGIEVRKKTIRNAWYE